MITLNQKYVLHIPCYKYQDGKLISLKNENIIDKLIKQLNTEGYNSFYITEVKGHYKTRIFNEILITIFTNQEENTPEKIFREWYKENNNILQQESYAYEHGTKMIIEEL
ncbi:hypothetical protein PXD04_08425 [Methanosphaera sp. ISO3-F5]|uniref:hypothetical protein n=1 Tax=Methanosphaera sp. ISO3-F5 TaxID=1452353 RepID=UPI002B263822|nr:hypothetical protein [Methanosphaera sp. ISO3-F5]WQH63719.1 hypothetical protein PXD04_08425 [Methanosphaera sp. ISO3-F5]